MKVLADLATSALLGTERRPPDWPVHEGELGDLIRAIAKEPAEKALLQTAGILGTCHLAGWKPPIKASTVAPAAGEDVSWRSAPTSLLSTLTGIFAEGPARLQAEASVRLAEARRHLPHMLLPRALECGRRSTALRQHLLPVCGRRGAWLAAQNEAWSFAAGSDGGPEAPDDQIWQHGSLEQRRLYLHALRKSDPAKAREIIIAALGSEGARERTVFIECLAISLNSADQDLLEAALADKSKEARQAAARLLSSLPESRFMQRMTARLVPCLSMEKKLLRGTVVTLEPPAAYDETWKADLIEEARPKGQALGERAWWLFQIVRAVPLDWWESHTTMKPADLLAWAQKSDWKDALLQGWAAAQAIQKRVGWAEAFLNTKIPAGSGLNVLDLLETLPLPLREKKFLRLFTDDNPHSVVLDRFLSSLPFDAPPLSHETAKPLLKFLKHRVNGGEARHDWPLRVSLVELACVIPTSLFDESATGWDITKAEVQPFAEAIARMGTVLDQRRQIQTLESEI